MNIFDLDSELISCQICSIKYSLHNNLPYALSCGHSYCKQCIDKLKKDSNIICPIDKKKIPVLFGVNSNKSMCKNIDLIKFLVLMKVVKKKSFEALFSYEFKYCEDCGVFISSLLVFKHWFMDHNLLNLNGFYLKYFNKLKEINGEKKIEKDIYKYYFVLKVYYSHDFSLIDIKSLDVEEYIIRENHFFVSFKCTSIGYFRELFENKDLNENVIKFGYLFKKNITIIGFFEMDQENKIINIFGLSIKKLENDKNYFLGYMFPNQEYKMDFGLYVDSNVMMFGKFSLNSSKLIYGETRHLNSKESDIIPIKTTNEHKFSNNEKEIKILAEFKREEIAINQFFISYIFDENNHLNEIFIEKNTKISEPYCKISTNKSQLEKKIMCELPIEFYFFGKNKIQIKFFINLNEFSIIFMNNYGILIQSKGPVEQNDFHFRIINFIKNINALQIYYKFNEFIEAVTNLFEIILNEFVIYYKYFNDYNDRELDYCKENYIFDLQNNSVKTKLSNREQTIPYTLKNKTLQYLINNILIEIDEVSNLMMKHNLSVININKRSEKTIKIGTIEKTKVHCKCIIF